MYESVYRQYAQSRAAAVAVKYNTGGVDR